MKMISDMLRLMADQLEGKHLPEATMETVLENKEISEVLEFLIETKHEGLSNIFVHLFSRSELNLDSIDYDLFEEFANRNREAILDVFTTEQLVEHLSAADIDTAEVLDLIDEDNIVNYIRSKGYWSDDDKSDLLKTVKESEGVEGILECLENGDIKEYMECNGYICSKTTREILEQLSERDDIESPLRDLVSKLDDSSKGMLLLGIDIDEFATEAIDHFLRNNFAKLARHIEISM